MGTAVGILFIVGLIGARLAYGNWLTKGIKPRELTTNLTPEALRSLFETRVARTGWKIIDDGNPMLAQSSLATGIRQQIGLTTTRRGEKTLVKVGPHRWVTKWGVPKKGHTMRIRMTSFIDAVQGQDAATSVTIGELGS